MGIKTEIRIDQPASEIFQAFLLKDNMNTKKHKLWDADARLFASMKGKYQSVNEENFFKNMQYKQEYETEGHG